MQEAGFNWTALTNLLVAVVGAAGAVLIAVLQARTRSAVDAAAAQQALAAEAAKKEVVGVKMAAQVTAMKVEAVAITNQTQTQKLDALAEVAAKTHTLVNSEHGKALEAVAVLARWKAEQTRDPADADAARAAERTLAEHQGKQAVVDKNEATP